MPKNNKCPHCEFGVLIKKQSRFGEFYGCDQFPCCAYTKKTEEPLDVGMAGYKIDEVI